MQIRSAEVDQTFDVSLSQGKAEVCPHCLSAASEASRIHNATKSTPGKHPPTQSPLLRATHQLRRGPAQTRILLRN